jgi:hypothetical protein
LDSEGGPHISLICSLQARNSRELIWGQFIEGLSKKHVKSNPKTGFLIMSFNREMWRGRALWTHEEKEGPEYVMYNDKPLYRYNSYTSIHTVHYMDLVDITEKKKLSLAAVGYGMVLTSAAKGGAARKDGDRAMKPFAEGLFNKTGSLKFISYIDSEGFPVIVPIIQAAAADSRRIVFSTVPFKDEILNIPRNSRCAVLGMTLDMEDVLVKGKFDGFTRVRGVKTGIFDIERVYNSMPPAAGYIYPQSKIEAVTEYI